MTVTLDLLSFVPQVVAWIIIIFQHLPCLPVDRRLWCLFLLLLEPWAIAEHVSNIHTPRRPQKNAQDEINKAERR